MRIESHLCAQKQKITLEYKREEKGEKEHRKIYNIKLYLNDKKVSSAESQSIKQAEQKAARIAVESIIHDEKKT